MSDKRNPADAIVQGATNRAALELCIEPLRLAARCHGYAIAVHGSLARDVDLIAIPWTANAADPDVLVTAAAGAIAGALGKCHPRADWAEMPHGRRVPKAESETSE